MAEQNNLLVQTLVKFTALIIGFESECPAATKEKFHRASSRLNARWQQLELTAQRISGDTELLIKARREVLDPKLLDLMRAAPGIDIETFYVIVRSMMDDIAALTPYFYPKGPKEPASYSFKDQIKWYKKNIDFDPPMTEYLSTYLEWFTELKDVRDDLLHRQADVLPINTSQKDEQGEFSVQFDIITKDFGLKLGAPDLIMKLRATLRNLLEFLDFYSGHFKNRIPKDWPSYKDLGGASPKGGVHGLELLKRWSEQTPIQR